LKKKYTLKKEQIRTDVITALDMRAENKAIEFVNE